MKCLLAIAGIFIGDEKIKQYIEKEKEEGKREEILNGTVLLTKHHNRGAVFNWKQENPQGVLITSCIAFGGVLTLLGQSFVKDSHRIYKLGLSVITGGALSNLYDRIKRGYVVDYFIIQKKPWNRVIFNLSDWCIFIGGALTMLGSLMKKEK
ncbi:signal peptidase II [Velocimicrobium porci]|nr:signal peptidase II [Velocimicrobium porci]